MNHLAFDSALTAVAIVASRGCEIPAELVQADQLVAQLRRLSGPSPEPPLPAISGLTADELRAVLGQAARERVEREALRDIAGSLVGPSVADYLAQFRQAWPSWLPTLRAQFAEALEEFTDAARTAPASLTASTTEEQAAAHLRMLRSSAALDGVLRDRVLLGESVAEENGGGSSLLLVAEPPAPPTDPAEFNRRWPIIEELPHTYSRLTGVDRWHALLASDYVPSLALAGEVGSRRAAIGEWQRLSSLLNVTYGGSKAFGEEMAGRPRVGAAR